MIERTDKCVFPLQKHSHAPYVFAVAGRTSVKFKKRSFK